MFKSTLLLLFSVALPFFINTYPLIQVLFYAISIFQLSAEFQRSSKSNSKTQEKITREDALKFPIYASMFLFGIYLFLKVFHKEYYTSILITLYFSYIGFLNVIEILEDFILPILFSSKLIDFIILSIEITKIKKIKFISFLYNYYYCSKCKKENKNEEENNWEIKLKNLISMKLSALLIYFYFKTKHPLTNNLIAISFVLKALREISIDSFSNSVCLLLGLFLYDVFWVYASNVMVTVASKLEVPIKLALPFTLKKENTKIGFLGLGDIVIPGIHILLMDKIGRKFGSEWFYKMNVYAYSFSMVICYWALETFKRGQPALFFIVPALIGASLLVGLGNGQLGKLIWYIDEEGEHVKEKIE